MSALNVEGFRHKLAAMNSTQDSVQTMALWVTHHKNHSKQIVEVWIQSLRDATKESHRLTLMYLANDVIQASRRKGGAVFKEAFSPVLEEAVALCRDEAIRKNVLRIITIWEERKVLDSDFCERLQAATVSTRRPKPKVDAQFLAAFNPTDVPTAIENLAQFEGEVELKRNQLNNLNLDVASMESISKLKDRAGGKRFSEQFEDGAIKLEEFVKLLQQEVQMRKELVELLKKCEIFYEAQSSEAKIVTNAYRNFSTRVGSLKKRLDEYKRHLPGNKEMSPIPSPTVDAPSPGATPPDDPATDKVNTEDMEVSDEEGGVQHGSIMAVATNNKRRTPSQRVPPPPENKPENLETLTKLTGASFLTGKLAFTSSAMDTPSPTGSNISAPSPENSPSDAGEPDEPYEPGGDEGPIAPEVTEPPPGRAEPVKMETAPPPPPPADQADEEAEAEAEWQQLEAELEKAQAAAEPAKQKKQEPAAPSWLAQQPEMSFYGSRTASPLVPYPQEDEGGSSDGTKDGDATPLRDESQEGDQDGGDGKESLQRVVEEATSNPIGFLSKIINRSQTSQSSSPKPSDAFISSLNMLAKSAQAPLPTTNSMGSHGSEKLIPKKFDPAKHPFGLGQFLANLGGAKPDSEPEESEDENQSLVSAGYGSNQPLPTQEPSHCDDHHSVRKNSSRGKIDIGRESEEGKSQTFLREDTNVSATQIDESLVVPPPDEPSKAAPKLPPGPPPGPPPPDARRGPSKRDNQEGAGEGEQGEGNLGQSMIMYEMASDEEDEDNKPQSLAGQFDTSSFLAQGGPNISTSTFTTAQGFMGKDVNAELESSLYTSSSYSSTLGTQSSSYYGSSYQDTLSTWSTSSNARNLSPSNGYESGNPVSTDYDPSLSSIPGLDVPSETTNQPASSNYSPTLGYNSVTSYNPTSSYNPMSAGYLPGIGFAGMDPSNPPTVKSSFNSPPASSGVSTMDPSQPPPTQTGFNSTPVASESYIPGIGLPDMTHTSASQKSYSSSDASSGAGMQGLGVPTMDPTLPSPMPNQVSYNPTPMSNESKMPGPGGPDMMPSQPPSSQTSLYSPPISSKPSIPPIPSVDPCQPPPTLNQTGFTSPPVSGSTNVPGIPSFVSDQPPPPPPVEQYSPTGGPTTPTGISYQPSPLGNERVPPPLPMGAAQAQPHPSPGYYSRQNSDGGNPLTPPTPQRMPSEDSTGYYQPMSGSHSLPSMPPAGQEPFPTYPTTEQFRLHPSGYQSSAGNDGNLSPVGGTEHGFRSPPTGGGDFGYQKPWHKSETLSRSDAQFGGDRGFYQQEEISKGYGPRMDDTRGIGGAHTQGGAQFVPTSREDHPTNNNYPPLTDEPTSPISVISPRHPNKSPRSELARQSSTIQILGSRAEYDPDQSMKKAESEEGDWDQEDPMGNMFRDETELPMVRPPHRGRFQRGAIRAPMRHRLPHPVRPYRTPFMRPRGGTRPRWPGGPRPRFLPGNRPPFGWR